MAKPPASGRSPVSILEDLAGAVMSADPADVAAVGVLIALLDELAATQHPAVAVAAPAAARLRSASADVRALAGALDAASEEIARMQDACARLPRAAPAPTQSDPGSLVMPEWGDEKILDEFLANQRGSIDELESAILAMEGGDPETRAAFKRRLHTMKGEAGVLGLDDMQRICHATEDLIEARGASAELTDRLLKVRDWMAKAVDAYGRRRLPQPNAAEFIANVLAEATPAPPSPGAPPVAPAEKIPAAQSASGEGAPEPAPAQAAAVEPKRPAVLGKVERDAETVSLYGEFLSESGEGLNRVDQILMSVESNGVTPDTINSLFRVFHTVKGTAGFLELAEVIALAHDTETMLNRCRENALKLDGPVIDLVFDATTALREMLESVRLAIEAGTEVPSRPGLQELLRRIEETTLSGAPPEEEVPAPEPKRDIVVEASSPPSAAPEVVEVAGKRDAPSPGEDAVATSGPEPEPLIKAAPAPAPARSGQPEQEGPAKIRDTIKVDLERVDSLVEMIGELVVVESMVVNAPEISRASSVRVRNCLAQLAKVTRDLQDVGMRMRMVPVAGVFQKMARLVRDLSRKSGKQVRLVSSGESTEMDRSMVEQIADPLVHMIRNACDHGLEPAAVRTAAGKPPVGEVRLSAFHEGGSVVIEIADDGRGLDRAVIVRKAIEKGLITSAEAMSEAEIFGLIFAPGFSTAEKVTEISGRGVGMDVVKRNIDAMRGRVLISSTPGKGTTFKLVLPLTLAIIDGMLVACGDERYIIPT
ncbi:MAG TPA: chemotaxis protein CheA, partial [Anaeromyxobacteraceae bacterium]|nr:chemotaxis protein CheA [Anaeromyxobacteraceae bacterium]